MIGILVLLFILEIVVYFGNIIKYGIGLETFLGTLSLIILMWSAFSTKDFLENHTKDLDFLQKAREGSLLKNENSANYGELKEKTDKLKNEGFQRVMLFICIFTLSLIVQVSIYVN